MTKSKKHETFILIMPSFNEEKRIEKTIKSWVKIINKHPGSEMLIIDGNSNDKTRQTIAKLQKDYDFISLIHKKREGYGKDLVHGYKAAIKSKHDWIFQTDTDSPIKTKDFYKLWNKRNTSPFIIGRRKNRKDPKYRLVLAFLIEFWIMILFKIRIKDPNIPFRLIKRNYLKKILSKVPPSTIAPNIFLTILANKDGYNLQSIPVTNFQRENFQNVNRILKGAFAGFFELIVFTFAIP